MFQPKVFFLIFPNSKVADVKAADKKSAKSADDRLKLANIFSKSGRCTDYLKSMKKIYTVTFVLMNIGHFMAAFGHFRIGIFGEKSWNGQFLTCIWCNWECDFEQLDLTVTLTMNKRIPFIPQLKCTAHKQIISLTLKNLTVCTKTFVQI